MREILCAVVTLYFLALIGRILLSWFPMQPGGAGASIASFLYGITEPVLAPLRRVIPPVGVGGMGLDLSPIIVIFAVSILRNFLCR